jgi:hypothetical protein
LHNRVTLNALTPAPLPEGEGRFETSANCHSLT